LPFASAAAERCRPSWGRVRAALDPRIAATLGTPCDGLVAAVLQPRDLSPGTGCREPPCPACYRRDVRPDAPRRLDVPTIAALFAARGHRSYAGEGVSQLEHALQTAAQAEEDGAPPALRAAALLHDLGHLLSDLEGTPTLRGIDDGHERAALPALRGLFGEEVLAPIRWHVDAKRFLCATEPAYERALSDDSRRSLVLQGGPMTRAEQAAFVARPHAAEALRLRRWDDRAKVAGEKTPPFEHFLGVLESCVVCA